jgi:hypothetical protein
MISPAEICKSPFYEMARISTIPFASESISTDQVKPFVFSMICKSKILKNYSLHSGQTFTQISAIARWGTSPRLNLVGQELNGFDGYQGWSVHQQIQESYDDATRRRRRRSGRRSMEPKPEMAAMGGRPRRYEQSRP